MLRTTISEDYQVAIPEEVRRKVPLEPGGGIRISAGDGVITLVPESHPGARYPFPEPAKESPTFDELVEAQGVKPVTSLDDLRRGWPEDELDDGFEIAVRRWRDEELRYEDE